MAMVATGESDEAVAAAADIVRIQIAFYGSTPAYRPMLDVIGRGELQPQLRDLSTQGRWDEMTALVDDDLLHACWPWSGRPARWPPGCAPATPAGTGSASACCRPWPTTWWRTSSAGREA